MKAWCQAHRRWDRLKTPDRGAEVRIELPSLASNSSNSYAKLLTLSGATLGRRRNHPALGQPGSCKPDCWVCSLPVSMVDPGTSRGTRLWRGVGTQGTLEKFSRSTAVHFTLFQCDLMCTTSPSPAQKERTLFHPRFERTLHLQGCQLRSL